jgi:transcriptional regulator with XRE-family HTH domain
VSTIGTRLRQERVRIGLTQRDLGKVGGVTANIQGLYEKDRRSPRATYLSKILAVGIDVIYVLTGKPVPPAGTSQLDGISDPLDAIFDAYLAQSQLLGKLSENGAEVAGRLAAFCQNQLTIIAAIKYLAAVAEVQGYDNVPERVASTLKALNSNALIIAEVMVTAGWQSDRVDESAAR